MRRTSSAADERSETPAELIARISAEYEPPPEDTGRHHRAVVAPAVDPADVRSATRTARRRSLLRRLAPLAVGASVMLVAAMIVAVVRPTTTQDVAEPQLSAILGATDPDPVTTPPVSPTTTAVATSAGPVARPGPQSQSARTSKPKASGPRTTPAPGPPRPVAPAAGDGVQVATAKGWTKVGGDEFTGALSPNWGIYTGEGNDGDGTRSAGAVHVENGSLVIRGDADGNTGGLAWTKDQRFGKWEMRAKFPRGDKQYHPVLILWPSGAWPKGGEIDFAETDSAADDVSFFLHYSSSNKQKSATRKLDLTQWHNYAVEWVDGRVTGYVDGAQWFESTDGRTMPPEQMHPTIQLDYFPDGGSPKPTEMYVDYLRIYR